MPADVAHRASAALALIPIPLQPILAVLTVPHRRRALINPELVSALVVLPQLVCRIGDRPSVLPSSKLLVARQLCHALLSCTIEVGFLPGRTRAGLPLPQAHVAVIMAAPGEGKRRGNNVYAPLPPTALSSTLTLNQSCAAPMGGGSAGRAPNQPAHHSAAHSVESYRKYRPAFAACITNV